MKNLTFKICAIIMAIFIFLAVAFYFIAGESFRQSNTVTEMVSPKAVTGELHAGQTVTQKFTANTDTLNSISVMGGTYAKANTDTLTFSVSDDTGSVIGSGCLETENLSDNSMWTVNFAKPLEKVNGKTLTLSITSEKGAPGNAVALYFGDSVNMGKFEVAVESDPAYMDGSVLAGELCMTVTGTSYYKLASYYWYFMAALGLLLAVYLIWMLCREKKGKSSQGLRTIAAFSRYHFLFKQLVARDFKTKYKRSVLGMFWSFLNPLLTMLVMYIVFSTLFKSNIANFPVYLLSGIIVWSFFSEATSMCLGSITGNASLITKVYVPKYMYPFSRAVSSLINFGFSLLPLFVVLIITHSRFTVAFLLLPFPIICLFFFALGMGLLLSSAMVFFRDTQFLWGVVSMLWMYLTPIFYDVSIIPARFMALYKLNPLYHIVRVLRILLIQGVSPEPKAYLLCFFAAFLPFLIGLFIFRKTQDRFVLYL
jgi:ABC-2 type transport system permease protein